MAKSKSNDKVLKAVRPNLGIEIKLRRQIECLLDEMAASILYWVRAAYRQNEPVMAQDRVPASELRAAIRKMAKRWTKNWNEASPKLARYFALSAAKRSDRALMKILRDAGIAVDFRMTPAMRDVLNATVNQNVSLIKSIPARYLSDVEQLVMRSVQTGRDLGQLSRDLQKRHGVTKKRAALISKDQNSKATSAFNRVRRLELGLTESVWRHSYAGKTFRPTHVKMDGKRFDTAKGMWDSTENRWVQPGELINCKCFANPIVPGFA